MIYVSTACVKAATIAEAVQTLASAGFKFVELSGGTPYYPGYENDLLELQAKHSLSYLCHNYFPPPELDFVLNLSSADATTRGRTIDLLHRAVELSRKLGAHQFAFHAGFFVDLDVTELGSTAAAKDAYGREAAIERFCDGYAEVARAADGVMLYLENNALSIDHGSAFRVRKPFMLLDAEDIADLGRRLNFRLLLDLGHLKVSTQTLGLSFEPECDALIDRTDYLHVSDNDGRRDLSSAVRRGSPMAAYLAGKNLKDKTITLEIYEGLEHVKHSYELLEELSQ